MGDGDRVSTGTAELDRLLEGGYEKDSVTTIFGPAGAGKTNFALLAALAQAKAGKSTIYVDTEGGFSATRFHQLAGRDSKKHLKKLAFLQPVRFAEQATVISKLNGLISDKVGLIVVDTMGMLFRMERSVGEEGREFSRELGMQLRELNAITRRKKIPVLLTNQIYTVPDNGEVRIVGGDLLKYASKCLLELQILNQGWRRVTLRKHRSLPGERESLYRITHKGIEGEKESKKGTD